MGYEIKGYSFAYGARRGDLGKDTTKQSLQLLRETGTEWIALCVVQQVETKDSLKIRSDYNRNVTDLELMQMIRYAHEHSMKVCLKPMINCDDHAWRAEINFGEDKKDWDTWFHEYTGYMTRMAEIAEETGCEMFCLGCEMLGTEREEEHWRTLIAKVREVFNGPLIYNTNHGKEFVAKWYDAIDYIGTSAYYPVAKKGGASISEMQLEWEKVGVSMEKLYEKWKKPIVFMEIGCRSALGCATMPWDFMHSELPYDEEEQANFFESCLKTFWDSPWMAGFFWWDWSIHVTKSEANTKGFGIHGKKAETVLRDYYSKE